MCILAFNAVTIVAVCNSISEPDAYYQNVMHCSAYRGISIECDVQIQHFTLYFQSGALVETVEKKRGNAAEFLGSILHHANSFLML